MLDPYNLDTNVDLVKVIDNYKNHNHLYKSLKGLALHKGNFTTLSSLFKIAIAIFSLNMLLEDEAVS
ncbi:hypothetical protein C8035_v001829 [Colletotrichum spinosum]|uniref:Uncharacterized protein n=1 Tax=Colletotrichum spinosum TaxID=1347390 RepID=A0A4R8PR64_9PEZI|nr:hypothetical protein C8035_v001829 [Colletotrichum spinosum]